LAQARRGGLFLGPSLDPPGSDPPVVQRAPGILLAAAQVLRGFHARASAAGKRYRYRYAWGEKSDPAAWFLGTDAAPRWEDALSALASLKGLSVLSGLASPSTHRSAAPPLSAYSLERHGSAG
jgi:hypothetical protein